MTIAPGDDITGTPEPLPRDSLTNRLGGLARGWINYFQGKDRLTGNPFRREPEPAEYCPATDRLHGS